MPSKDSKQNFAVLRDKILAQNGKEYWRSVEEFVDAPEFEEFVKQEYPVHAEEWENGLSRRNFIKVMGASLAFAGLSGCVIQPAEKIVPFVTQPENMIPGKPLFYSTAMTLGGIATGLFAKSFDGRPIKVEGNPEHPGSLGATDVFAQASILGMYDPDRSQEVRNRGASSNWQNFMNAARTALDENSKDGGAGVRFLTETVTSPTLIAQFKQVVTELPNSKWIQYEPVNKDNATAGARLAFGSPAHTVYRFDQADKILLLDADIFSGFNVRYIKDFNKSRRFGEDKKQINRLYAIETTITLTGAKADHRLAVKPSQMIEVAKAVAGALGVSGAAGTGLSAEATAWITAMAKDLQASRGKSLVVAGDNQPAVIHALAHAINGALGNVGQTVVYTDPLSPNTEKTQIEQLRELIADIDAGRVRTLIILGGNPIYTTPIDAKLNGETIKEKVPLCIHLSEFFNETSQYSHWHIPQTHFLEEWGDARAYDGTISISQPIIKPLYGGKSIYEVVQVFFKENYDKTNADILKEYWQKTGLTNAPKTVAATASTATTPQTSPSPNATPAANASPQASVSPTPTMAEGVSPSSRVGEAAPATPGVPAPTPMVQGSPTAAAAGTSTPKTFEDNWRKVVHDGFIPGSGFPAKTLSANTGFLSQAINTAPVNGLEISILPDPCVYDGRFTNNGWLQELPNPLTKITWENVALISPRTANRLGLNQSDEYNDYSGGEMGIPFINTKGGNQFSDLVTIEANGAKISAPVPVWIAPGQPDDVITLYLGYGRTNAGRVGNGLGYNAYEVLKSDAPYAAANLTKNGVQTTIASTQIHFNMEGRDLLLTWDVENIAELAKKKDEHEKETGKYDDTMMNPEIYQKQYDANHRWGMTIDLNSCVGCNACVLACQSENNIPVVGKEQVERSREMHWMRVDAYFTGDDINNPDGPFFQPVLCQQCEQAPCEVVCPVHATVHSAEGLNDMVYNRCIGTRYCSNNCPYKVRRFNFLLFQDWDTPQYKLMRNPEVTIRSRGVMEKCTYCTQKISAARIESQKAGRPIADGEILTACQSVCPADAIVFGDLNNKESKVFKMKQDERNYVLLNELNTQPRTTYLAALKNQNKEMPDYRAPKNDHGTTDGESH
ncbi:MAG: TAT-variant-translocated molybdopterin oxidoreductase [Pyrinomonadaceae bacterium]